MMLKIQMNGYTLNVVYGDEIDNKADYKWIVLI